MKKAFIFDMDGTLVDNMAYHNLAWQSVLHDFGIEASMEDVHNKAFGIGDEAYERFFGHRADPETVAAFIDAKEARYRQLYGEKRALIAGVQRFLERSQAAGIPMAIGTGSQVPNMEFIVDGLNIRPFFGAIVTAEQVKKGKPNPETFLIAAEKLGVAPENCIVFEDVPSGAQAAHNAGMKSVLLTTLFDRKLLSQQPSVLKIITNYQRLNPLNL
ncbi:MAG: hypothetical protein RL757_87 [Bacteroidota bacterium]|jgi:beta-phosphoglucomutase family hydrolase